MGNGDGHSGLGPRATDGAWDWRDVAVKVQYPGIQNIVENDLRNIRFLLRILQLFEKNLDFTPLVEEISHNAPLELDFINEGHNAEMIAKNFGNRNDIIVPKIVWEYSTRRVLVIDDNDDALELMALHIAALGGEAHTARDGQSGVEQAVKMRPDVVLIDIGMPGIDGYETCRRIRAELGPSAMLVAVSGWGQQQDKARAMASGFDEHLTKPADPAVLASLLAYAKPNSAS